MQFLNKTLATAAENLALDEALLESAEVAPGDVEVLRLWESPQYAAVLGRSSRAADEVDLKVCHSRGIPVVRRASGGGSVVIGPGCLMYSVVLSYQRRPQLRMIERAHHFVLEVVAAAVGDLVGEVQLSGTSDLTQAGRKFSGNSLRCKRHQLLYHGTLLYDFPLELISSCLHSPPRQPEYRADRSHTEFVTNLAVPVDQLRASLIHQWRAVQLLDDWPRARTVELTAEKFTQHKWNFGR